MKIQLPNVFKDHHIVAKPSPTMIGYYKWPLSIALLRKCYNSHGIKRIFSHVSMSVKFCHFLCHKCTWQHLNHPNLLVRAAYSFYVYFHVQLILHDLGISLPYEDGFSKVKNPYIKSAYYTICDNYGVNPYEIWIHRDWFYTTDYEVKATERLPPDNLTRWIITHSKSFTRKDIEKISRSVRA